MPVVGFSFCNTKTSKIFDMGKILVTFVAQVLEKFKL